MRWCFKHEAELHLYWLNLSSVTIGLEREVKKINLVVSLL